MKGLDRIEELGRARVGDHRCGDGLPRSGPDFAGAAAVVAQHRGRQSGMGRDESFALGVLASGWPFSDPRLLFSLEMGHLELTQRLLASEAEVNGQSLQNGRIRTQDWAKIGTAVTRLSQAPSSSTTTRTSP